MEETSHKIPHVVGACIWNVQNGEITDGNSMSGRVSWRQKWTGVGAAVKGLMEMCKIVLGKGSITL